MEGKHVAMFTIFCRSQAPHPSGRSRLSPLEKTNRHGNPRSTAEPSMQQTLPYHKPRTTRRQLGPAAQQADISVLYSLTAHSQSTPQDNESFTPTCLARVMLTGTLVTLPLITHHAALSRSHLPSLRVSHGFGGCRTAGSKSCNVTALRKR